MPDSVSLTTIIKNKSSQSLLDFLVQRFHYLTRSQWQERIQDGRVTVNEHAASEGQPLRAGDVVNYVTEPWEEPEVNKNYRVVYEDEFIFIVSKPAPLPVHAVGAYFQNTLMAILRKDIPEAENYQLVHRLDAETSGLLVLVKDKKYLKGMLAQWNRISSTIPSPQGDANRPGVHRGDNPYGRNSGNMGETPHERQLGDEGRVRGDGGSGAVNSSDSVGAGAPACPPMVTPVQKTYRAIVFGKFPPGPTRVEAPIGPNLASAVRMKLAVIFPENMKQDDGHPERERRISVSAPKPSITEFKLLEVKEKFSLVEARIFTGRTHQIRVHLEHLGYPIVGDKLYSGTDETFLHFYEKGWDEWLKEKVLLPRLALHACRLEFTHVKTGEKMVFEDPLPEDLISFWGSVP